MCRNNRHLGASFLYSRSEYDVNEAIPEADVRNGQREFAPIDDKDVHPSLQATLGMYRDEARRVHFPDNLPVAFLRPGGFTFLGHAPLAGPCAWDSSSIYTEDNHDLYSTNAIVFCVPELFFSGMTYHQQQRLLEEKRKSFKLSYNHFVMGDVATVAGVLLAYHKVANRFFPAGMGSHVRTSSSWWGGSTLGLGGFDKFGLKWNDWSYGDTCQSLGVVLMGVEERSTLRLSK